VKDQSCIRLDVDLKYWAKTQNINISQMVNDVLKSLRATRENNFEIIELENELTEIDKNLNKLNDRKIELLTKKISFEEQRKQQQLLDREQDIQAANLLKRQIAGDFD
jgi:hypothetical protein